MTIPLNSIKEYLEELSEESAAYFLFAILLLLSAVTSFISSDHAKAFFGLSIICLCYGFFVFLTSRLKQIWESPTGKLG